jgi:hypothetical protein
MLNKKYFLPLFLFRLFCFFILLLLFYFYRQKVLIIMQKIYSHEIAFFVVKMVKWWWFHMKQLYKSNFQSFSFSYHWRDIFFSESMIFSYAFIGRISVFPITVSAIIHLKFIFLRFLYTAQCPFHHNSFDHMALFLGNLFCSVGLFD